MQQFFKKTLALAAALACCATTVHASDAEGEFHGYFRAGVGSNDKGGSQACYGLEGVPKYRFGNECDLYGEFSYTKELAKSSNGASFVGTVMASIYSPMSDVGEKDKLRLAQMMVEAKNLPFLNGATAWIGKRFYDRPDIHVLDFKYLHGDGVGGGIAGIAAGPGKFSYALFRNDINERVAATRHSFIYDGIPVSAGGTLKLDATVIRGDQQDKAADKVANGWSFSVVHKQDKLLGGDNTLAVQYGSGSGIKMGGTDTGATSDIKRTRVFDNMIWQFTPEFSGSLVGLWQRDKANAGTTTWTSVGVRPVYALNENVKLIVDFGHDNVKPANGGAEQKLNKITFAPALSQGKGFWARPELRAFVTYAKWNDAAQRAATPGSALSSTGVFGGKTNGMSYGLQVESWF
ncbi:maltoporin [Janthinobacterium fluminis]|uniref:Carbohydrate porin n=1 Tax=Janthinobacterium fluminis TaxID=2987524 RepID=A0ABT5JYR3_9BURK|nr:carbohydrate porin [Janthinobacterium fluminis]MDC8757789.1 carbohydrate porin [Janthinobacterium fluminis]